MKLYRIALRNISRNKRRSILSASAISVAGFAIVFLFSMLAGILSDMEDNIFTYISGEVRIRNSNFDKYERLNPMHFSIPEYKSLITALDEIPAISAVSPRIKFSGKVAPVGIEQYRNIQVTAVDFRTEPGFQDYTKTLIEGELPKEGSPRALVGAALARKLNVAVGDKITIQARTAARGSRAYTFTVAGILKLPMPGIEELMIQIPLDIAQKFLWLPGQVQEIFLKLEGDLPSPQAAAQMIRAQVSSSVPLNILSYKEINNTMGMMEMASKIYDIIGILFFLLAGTVIVNTTFMVIVERTREIGTMAALGMGGRQLVRLFFLESLFISIAGALAGILIGVLVTGVMTQTGLPLFSGDLEGMDTLGISSVIYPQINFRSTVLVFIYALLVSCLTTWLPARRAAKISPVEAMRNV